MSRNRKFLLTTCLLVLFLLWMTGTFRTYLIIGSSDMPTFFTGDKVIVNRSAYDLTLPFTDKKMFRLVNPHRGDMVLCSIPGIQNSDFWIKRIIGLPGDTLMIIDNKLIINGKRLTYSSIRINLPDSLRRAAARGIFAMESGMGLKSTILYSEIRNILSDYGPIVIDEDHYFLLGDNRQNSLDSRIFGLIPREMIFGKFFLRISSNI